MDWAETSKQNTIPLIAKPRKERPSVPRSFTRIIALRLQINRRAYPGAQLGLSPKASADFSNNWNGVSREEWRPGHSIIIGVATRLIRLCDAASQVLKKYKKKSLTGGAFMIVYHFCP